MQRHSIVSFGLIVTALMVTVAGTAFAFECSPAVKARARDFIDNEKQFHLGFLPTEQSNPITATLEEDFRRSTLAGVQCLQRGDRQIPITMRHVFASAQYRRLVDAMAETLQAPKGRIVFSGCGATGRLSILLESMWRDFFHRRAAELTPAERALADRSASIMTGGDFALIKSVESFEDSMAGGERQAADLRIGESDTFVAITEGGETSSVLGTLRYAAAHGARCFLVFNNPADLLRARLTRCREAIDNPKVTVIDLYCGSMSLAGSTRMQATTSEQLLGSCALEAALCRVLPRFAKESAPDCTVAFEKLLSTLESPAVRAEIAAAIDFEKSLYARKGRITYFADDCMLDLFTDTTERSPTFMLPPFRSTDEDALAPSWAFVKNPLYDTEACWQALFHRNVRCLEWTVEDYAAPGMPVLRDGNPPKIGRRFLMKYPIGREDTPRRYADGPSAAVIVRAGKPDAAFESAARAQAARFGETRLFAVAASDPSPLEVWKHLAVKLTFNNLSTGTMAAMGRVAGNWMSWVSISNKKLIDRGIRLISELGRIPYEEAAQRLFAADEWIQSQDWTGKETPCAVQIALEKLRTEGGSLDKVTTNLTVTVRPKSTDEALVNPDMGFVYYHYSNRLWAYGMNTASGDTLDWFPGCSTIYYRLLWNDLEPTEGDYRWDILDSTAQNWIAKGKKLAFRIICCNQTETATPQFVRDAGAKGFWFEYKTDTAKGGKLPPRWEPVYDDSVFLAKLENFVKAFARRYDGNPNIAFVDIGSFGIYGEGHMWNTTQQHLHKAENRSEFTRLAKLHIDLWKRLLPNTYLVISDDIDGAWSSEVDPEMMRYCREKGIGFRDDSIFCFPPKGTVKNCPFEFWAHDGWARKFAPKWPVVVETGHAPYLHGTPKWDDDAYVRCVEAYQASYMSIHDFPDVHLRECRGAIDRINRILGYRFELKEATFPSSVRVGEKVEIASTWANVGVAPRTKPTSLTWSLLNDDGTVAWSVTDGNFDFRSLEPKLGGVEKPVSVRTPCRFGFVKPIPQPDNCVVWARKKGRVFDDTVVMLKPGTYTLAVSVGSLQGTPEIALPLPGGRPDRRYPLGRIVVRETPAASALPDIGFTLYMTTPATNAQEKVVSSVQMKSRTIEEKGGKTCIVWRGHPKCGDGFTVTAELTPTPEKDGWSYAFRYSGNESGLGVRLIEFPVLTVPRTDKTAIFCPKTCGQIRRPKWADVKPGANVAMAAMGGIHFMAALNGKDVSWYMDQRGDARLRPNWSIARNGAKPQTVTLIFRHAPQLTDENRVAGALPFGGTIRTFRGDWFAAAEIYRRWAWEQPWAKAAFARPQKEMRNIAIWFWNRGRVEDVVPPVERFQQLTGLPVALDWYWWHKIPYDVGYPFFWPPREGAEAFSAAVRRLVAKGIFVQPYTNGVSWDQVDPTWETEGTFDSIVEKSGTKRGHQYNVYMPSALAVMCGSAPHFHARMRELMKNLRGSGLPGVYMDQVGGCTVRACWSPDHPHAPGGGTVITDGYRKLFRDIKADNPGFCISTEDTPEAYLDIVDSAINLWQNGERFGMPAQPEAETVPAFMAVYHGAMAVYGSYAVIDGIPPWDPTWPDRDRWPNEKPWEELYPDQYALEFARGVAMGMQPMVHQLRMIHFDDPRYAGNFKFTVDTAKFYHANRDFLYDGTMCAPGTLTCARQPVELFIRGIYTKPEKARVVRHPSHSTILHSVWRAKDGRVAAILCNWSRKEQRYNLSTPDITAVGVIPARSWKLIEKQERNEK